MGRFDKAAMIAGGAIGAGLAARAVLRRARAADLTGEVVLITGGSRGLGLAMAREFARHGCRIAMCARDRAELDAVEDRFFTVECDVTDQRQVERMIEKVRGHYGAIDILVNNAGVIQVGPIESMTIADFEEAMNVMFWGMVYPTMAVLPDLRRRGRGRIVNITSIGGKVSVPHLVPYDCAKFAAVGFSEGLRAELAGTGVKVTTIVPWLMRTGSYLNAYFKGQQEREAGMFALSSTLPGVTMSAHRAARQVVEATRRGDAEKILGTQANIAARIQGMFPGFTANMLGWVNRMLPRSGGPTDRVRGRETTAVHTGTMKALTTLGRRAAREFNEV